MNKGLIEVPAGALLPSFVVSEPFAINVLTWRGRSLETAITRQLSTNDASIFYTFVGDKNASGLIEFADDFVVAEYLVRVTNASLFMLSRQPIASLTPVQCNGLASVNFFNRSNEVFFTGEPDGQLFAWASTGATNPLQRQLFSAQHAGQDWHALAGVKTAEPGEGLVGWRVDPAADSDGDGLPDAWELQFFGGLAQSGTDEFDGDGFSNVSEYLAGTDPRDANSSLRLRIEWVGGGFRIDWLASTNGTKILQRRFSLDSGDAGWLECRSTRRPRRIAAASSTRRARMPSACIECDSTPDSKHAVQSRAKNAKDAARHWRNGIWLETLMPAR